MILRCLTVLNSSCFFLLKRRFFPHCHQILAHGGVCLIVWLLGFFSALLYGLYFTIYSAFRQLLFLWFRTKYDQSFRRWVFHLSQSLRLLTSLYTQFFYMVISATERVEDKNKTLYLFNLQFVFGTSIVARTKSGAHKYQVLLTEARRGAASLKWDFGKGYLKMKAYLKQRIHWEAASRTSIKQIISFFEVWVMPLKLL